jgi:hypothetical protein
MVVGSLFIHCCKISANLDGVKISWYLDGI